MILHAVLTIAFGLLLLFIPGRTLTFVAVLAGISLCVIGLVDLVRVFGHGLSGAQRAAQLGVGMLALVVGVIVIVRPEGSIKFVAIATGFYLVVMGAVRILLGGPGADRRLSWLRGGLGLVAGTVLLAWPDVSVGVIAAVYGLFLIAMGAAELVFVLILGRRVHDTA